MDGKCAKRVRLGAEGGAGARAADTGGGSDGETLLPLFAAAADNETQIPLGEVDYEDGEASEVCNNAAGFYKGLFFVKLTEHLYS